jgi:membrane-associated phospholipid phosphatase
VRVVWICLLSLCAVLASSRPARADENASEHYLEWRYRRFSTIEYGATANLALQLAFIEFRLEAKTPNWEGGILFDDAARDVLRLESAEDKALAGTISDPMTLGLQIAPVALDSVIIPLVFDRLNIDVAWQMLMIDIEALTAVGFFNRFGHRVVKRARPSVEDCKKDPEFDELCESGKYASFPSGHASGAFAGAGLSCAHHLHLPLYGGGAPDILLGCALPLTTATTDAVLRLMADRHYVSDVIVGSLVGFAGGFGLPTLLHYAYESRDPLDPDSSGVDLSVQPAVTEQELVLLVGGAF